MCYFALISTCTYVFRLTNHKRSKKHKENEALLRAHMMEEDAQLLGEGGLEENLEEEEEIQEEIAPKQK